MKSHITLSRSFMIKAAAACSVTILIFHFILSGSSNSAEAAKSDNSPPSEVAVDLTENQLNAIKIGPVETYDFHMEKEETGSVAYHEKGIGLEASVKSKAHYIVANVLESDSPSIHIGQPVQAKLLAYPDRSFEGKVTAIGVSVYDAEGNPALDPNTHRISVRCEMSDPKNELYPGMLATVVFQVHKPTQSPAIPENGVVREGDGTMTAWTTSDRHHFTQRTVKVGLRENGKVQILDGLNQGELAVTDGAIFLDNMLQAPSDD